MTKLIDTKEVMRVAETSFFYNDEEFRNTWCFTTTAEPDYIPTEEVIQHIFNVIENNDEDTWEDENEEPLPIAEGFTAFEFATALVKDPEGCHDKYGISWDFRVGDEWSDDPNATNCF